MAAVSQLIRTTKSGVLETSGTRVARAHRGQKLAWALKYLALEEAVRRGAISVKTSNNVRNAPMRHINIELGFLPLPANIVLQRKLEPET